MVQPHEHTFIAPMADGSRPLLIKVKRSPMGELTELGGDWLQTTCVLGSSGYRPLFWNWEEPPLNTNYRVGILPPHITFLDPS